MHKYLLFSIMCLTSFGLKETQGQHNVKIYANVINCTNPNNFEWRVYFEGTWHNASGTGLIFDKNFSAKPKTGSLQVIFLNGTCSESTQLYSDDVAGFLSYDLRSDNCKTYLFSGVEIGVGVSVSGGFTYKAAELDKPMIDGIELNETICSSETLFTSGSATQYVWQVSDSEISAFREFKRTVNPSASIEESTFERYGFTNEKLYFRVYDSGCPGRTSDISTGYTFGSPPPNLAILISKNISCFGDQNGEILINNIKFSDNSAYTGGMELDIEVSGPDNIEFLIDNFTGTELHINENMVKSLYHASSGVKAGTWEFSVENDTTGCGKYFWGSVIVEGPSDPVTTANAGIDQKACGATAILAANAVDATDETGEWLVVSGSGTFQNISSRTSTVTGLEQGPNIFRWTIIQNYGCTSSDDVIIDRLNITTSNAGANKIVCEPSIMLNGNTPATDEYGTWEIMAESGLITEPNLPNSTVTGLSEGTNTFKWIIRDSGDVCLKEDQVEITYLEIAKAQAGADQSVCTPSAILSANAPKEGESGEWTLINGSGNFNDRTSSISEIEGLAEGVNRLRWAISDITGQCGSTADTLEIILSDLHLSEVIEKRKNPSCADANDGEIVVAGTGGMGLIGLDYEFNLSNGDKGFGDEGEEVTFAGLSAGFYTVTITDKECTRSYQSPIQLISPQPVSATFTETSINCKNATDGALNLTSSGGTPPYTFLWSTGATTEDLTNIGSGTYSVTITDANGCQTSKDYTLTEPFELQAEGFPSDYNGVGVSCNGRADGAIDVSVTGGTSPYTFSWSNDELTEDLVNLNPGLYSVVITDKNNCSININDIEITNPPRMELVVSDQNNVDCKGNATGSVIAAASGGVQNYEYTIDGATWQTSNTFSNLTAGSYTITVRDANGCSASASTTITEPETLTGTVFNIVESTCGEGNGAAEAQAAGGTKNYTYTWTNASDVVVGNAAVLSGVGGGIYRVLITDANGCTIEMTANISSADGPQTTAIDIVSTSCFDSHDGQATLDISGSEPFEVAWENGETGASATALYPGDNVVTITDVNGCVAVEVVNIPAPDPISYTITSTVIPTCHDSEDGGLEVTASGGSGSYTYVWETGVEGNSLQNISSGSYALTISDANGCVLQTTITLEGVEPIQVRVENSTLPTCVGDADGSLVVSASGGNGGYSYSWSTGTEGTTLDQIAAGTYELTVTDSKGCALTENTELPDPEPFTIYLGNEIEICTGSSYAITAPIANATYKWTADNGFTSADQEVILSTQGEYNLHVTNQEGCEAEDSFYLKVSDDLLNADFLMATEGYAGDTIVIIDISWHIPDDLTWSFGDDVTVLMENKDYAEVVFAKPGTYAVDIEVGLADCRDFHSQAITILGQEKGSESGRMAVAKEELIKTFKISPNPTDGAFKVEVELSRQEAIRLTMVDISGNRIAMDRHCGGKDNYELEINLPGLLPGIYLLTLHTAGKARTLRSMVK